VGQEDGHVLVFLTGQEEIQRCCNLIQEKYSALKKEKEQEQEPLKPLMVLPLYAALQTEDQRLVFKCVFRHCNLTHDKLIKTR